MITKTGLGIYGGLFFYHIAIYIWGTQPFVADDLETYRGPQSSAEDYEIPHNPDNLEQCGLSYVEYKWPIKGYSSCVENTFQLEIE